jgi:hypothetical protein
VLTDDELNDLAYPAALEAAVVRHLQPSGSYGWLRKYISLLRRSSGASSHSDVSIYTRS